MSHRRLLLSIVLVVGWLNLCGCDKESEQVRASYAAYTQAELNRDGVKGFMYVSRETIDYFANMQRLALEADHEQIRKRPFADRLFVATMRHEMDPNYLKSLTSEQVFMVGIRDGWLCAENPGSLRLEAISIRGDRATASTTLNGRTTPVQLEFVKEDGTWKFDPMSLMAELERMSTEVLQGTDMNEDEFIVLCVGLNSGEPVSPDIWKKPKLK